MAIATMEPVWTWVGGLTPLEINELDKAFAIPIPGVKYQPQIRKLIKMGRWDGCFHFFRRLDCKIATGLITKVLKVMPSLAVTDVSLKGYEADWERAREAARAVQLVGVELTDNQRAAVIGSIENRRGILKMATNSGKTEVGAAIAKALGLPTLWLVHRKDLLHQTAERLETRLGLPCGKIGDGEDKDGALVTVAMMQSLQPRTKWGKERLRRYKVFIADEAHHLSSATQQQVAFACHAPFRYAMGGSFPADTLKLFKIMAATDATLLYELTNAEQIASGWSASPTVHVHPVLYPDQVTTDEGLAYLGSLDYPEAYRQMIERNESYNQTIADEVENWYSKGLSVLVLVDRLAQGGSIGRKLGGKNISYEFLTGSHAGDYRFQKLKDFKSGKLPVMIATTIFDEGVDVPRVQALILASGGKSTIRLLQRVGRALRNKRGIGENCAHIVDFAHTGSSYMEKHFRAREKLYKSEKFDLVEEKEYDLRAR